MAWSAPKTWVDQETPSADDFNTEIRDNLDALSTHSHTGAAGDGSATLGSVDYIDLDEGGALSEPASNHTRFAANTDGTLRYRANGGTEKTVSDTTHTHTQAGGSGQVSFNTGTTGVGTSYTGAGQGLTQTPSDSTGTAQYGMSMHTHMRFKNANGWSGTVFLNLEVNSSEVASTSAAMPSPLNSVVDLSLFHFQIAGAASSTSYDMDVKKSGDTLVNGTFATLSIQEIRCQ